MNSQTAATIKMLMDKSKNYADLVNEFCEMVCAEDSPDDAVFLATYYANELYDYSTLDRIAKRYGKLQIIRPILFIASSHQGERVEWDKAREAADIALSHNLSEWLSAEMLLCKLMVDVQDYPGKQPGFKDRESLELLISNNPALKCLEARLFDILSHISLIEGDPLAGFNYNEKALVLARQFEDDLLLGNLLRMKAFFIQSSNPVQAKALLLKAKEIMTELGDRNALNNIFNDLGNLDAVRGEYSSAINNTLLAIEIRQKLGLPIGHMSHPMSTLYNAIGDYEAGLEWARLAEADLPNQKSLIPYALLNQAWSLIYLGQSSNAEEIIDIVREDVLKSGMEPSLAWYYFVCGISEMARGDLHTAVQSFEQAFDINQRSGRLVRMNLCRHKLAEVEIEFLQSNNINDATPFLNRLEEVARSEDFPGILGQALLLRCKLNILRGNVTEARNLLLEVDRLAKEPSMNFLNQELDRLSRII